MVLERKKRKGGIELSVLSTHPAIELKLEYNADTITNALLSTPQIALQLMQLRALQMIESQVHCSTHCR